ncbi:expansin-A23-like [Rhodamnia argentea]|uniref:Expansin n=1 Tax=Rhodamnia argentea TaxID=178133 RepID=A0ABM3HFG7_9MYRT|nr:expansin-A23-like [Rhodamnia argentea]
MQREAVAMGTPWKVGYGLETAALSTALFHGGLTCGACYEIKCHNSPRWCLDSTIRVTATNLCPPGHRSVHNWCNLPNQHFDFSQPMFGKIAIYEAGVVPILSCRALWVRSGGIRYEIKGKLDWIIVLVSNAGEAGDVKKVKVKGSGSEWISMAQNWGQNWRCSVQLVGQNLSF